MCASAPRDRENGHRFTHHILRANDIKNVNIQVKVYKQTASDLQVKDKVYFPVWMCRHVERHSKLRHCA